MKHTKTSRMRIYIEADPSGSIRSTDGTVVKKARESAFSFFDRLYGYMPKIQNRLLCGCYYHSTHKIRYV